jgi:hypothetical protein
MEARRKARSMKRSASMGRAASRSAARGKAKARAIGRARRGGINDDVDLEAGMKEQARQNDWHNQMSMEEGRSNSPPPPPSPRVNDLSRMEKGLGPKLNVSSRNKSIEGNLPLGDEMVGGKRRRRKSKKFYKGKASKSRKGRKDFVTHKGDKYFNRKGHRQTKRQGKSKGLFEQLFGL